MDSVNQREGMPAGEGVAPVMSARDHSGNLAPVGAGRQQDVVPPSPVGVFVPVTWNGEPVRYAEHNPSPRYWLVPTRYGAISLDKMAPRHRGVSAVVVLLAALLLSGCVQPTARAHVGDLVNEVTVVDVVTGKCINIGSGGGLGRYTTLTVVAPESCSR